MISTKHNFIIVFLMPYFMFNQNIYYSDGGEVTAPKVNGYFHKIDCYEQYTEYAKKANYGVLFFNYTTAPYELAKNTAKLLEDLKQSIRNEDITIYEVDMYEDHNIATEWDVSAAPCLISLRKGVKVEKVIPTLAVCKKTIEKFFSNLLGGHITAPKLDGNFYKILILEQFTVHTLKEPYAILFFNKSCNDEACNLTIKSLKEQMEKPENSAVKIYEVNFDDVNFITIRYPNKWAVNEAPYLISLRNGLKVDEMIPSKAPSPLSLDSFFSKLVNK